jgi:DNA-binding CsgD family transcriptional regulator
MNLNLGSTDFADRTQAFPPNFWPGGSPFGTSMLLRLLDEIDYGMALVTIDGTTVFTNRQAVQELESAGPLEMIRGQLHATDADDHDLLRLAIANAGRARRALVTLGDEDHLLSVAVQPFKCDFHDGDEYLALLTFGKRPVADTLRIALFARLQNITAAEARVLESLCEGVNPKDIATQQGVALSTVRSHISSMRVKTHSANIRELVGRVASLPPVSSAMKMVRAKRPRERGLSFAFDTA